MAYSRQRAFSYSYTPSVQSAPSQVVGANINYLKRLHYSSDPTLLDEREDGGKAGEYSSADQGGGRRSAMSMDEYGRSEENQNMAREARKVKRKKLKQLRSFVHVFFGGLRRKDAGREEERQRQDIASTRNRQRDERDGLARAVANGSSPREDRVHSVQNGLRQVPPGAVQRVPQPLELPAPCGLYNHGNTCFMNAVLQCLSNTDQLAEYFVSDTYKGDFNKNMKSLRLQGPSGNITEQFALLLKCLWSGQYNPVVSSRFKSVVGCYAEQYQGTAQHDAQEFFLWLLDSIHEDLNQARKRRYQPLKVCLSLSLTSVNFTGGQWIH